MKHFFQAFKKDMPKFKNVTSSSQAQSSAKIETSMTKPANQTHFSQGSGGREQDPPKRGESNPQKVPLNEPGLKLVSA